MRDRGLVVVCLLVSLALAIAIATASAERVARAQSTTASPSSSAVPVASAPPKLVAPRQLYAPKVEYPAGAHGEATVVLQLSIAIDGTVAQAIVLDGEAPFADVARDAALTWRFEAATKDGVRIVASIRAKVHFSPPSDEPATTPVAEPPKPAPTAVSAPPIVDDGAQIVVEAVRPEIGATSTGGAEIRILPGAFGDPFRMIEALPGVTPVISGLPYFYVRGAPPGNTGYFIDGIRVPLLFHLGAGPAVIAAGLVDRVDFYPGGYPAQYGRFTGGIVSGTTRAPLRAGEQRRGDWQVRLFDASAMLEAPLGSGKADGGSDASSGNALVAARYGYPGLLLSLVSPSVSLQYWDYQLRVAKQIDRKDRFSVFLFGAYDRLVDKKHDRVIFGSQFHRLDVRLDRELQDGGVLRLATTLGIEETVVGGDSASNGLAIRSPGIRVRAELDQRLSESVRLRAGADAGADRYLVVADRGADVVALQDYPSRTDAAGGVRADLILHVAPRIELVPGVRFDLYASSHARQESGSGAKMIPAIDPRFAVRLGFAKHLLWISSFAVAHQAPSFVVPIAGFQPSLAGGLQSTFQFAQGLEAELPEKITASLAVFRHTLLNTTDFIASCVGDHGRTGGSPSTDRDRTGTFCSIDDRVTGQTYGLEVLIKRALTERLGGWLAYTLSRSLRTFRGVTFLSDFDRTHVFTAVGSYDLGRGWRFGARFSYVTGRPVALTPDGLPSELRISKRLPDFYRVDARLEKRWQTSDTSFVTFVVEWFNATIQKEAIDFTRSQCTGDSASSARCPVEYIGPVTIPSIGVEGGF